MPVQAENSGADGLLDMLADPPVALLLKVAHTDAARTRGHRKLVFLGRPAHKGRSAVDAQQHQGGLPLLVACVQVPNVGVAVLGAGHDAVRLGGPVHGGDGLVVLGQGPDLVPGGAGLAEDVDHVGVEADGELCFVLRNRLLVAWVPLNDLVSMLRVQRTSAVLVEGMA